MCDVCSLTYEIASKVNTFQGSFGCLCITLERYTPFTVVLLPHMSSRPSDVCASKVRMAMLKVKRSNSPPNVIKIVYRPCGPHLTC